MKESKTFFDKDNRLNRGYANSDNIRSNKEFYRKRFEQVFPSPDVMQAMEEISSGSTERVIALAAKEQEHRHAIERVSLEVRERANKLGQLFALFALMIIGFTTYKLAAMGFEQVAIAFAIVAFSSILLISILCNYRNKRPSNKNHPRDRDSQSQGKRFNRNNAKKR